MQRSQTLRDVTLQGTREAGSRVLRAVPANLGSASFRDGWAGESRLQTAKGGSFRIPPFEPASPRLAAPGSRAFESEPRATPRRPGGSPLTPSAALYRRSRPARQVQR